MAESVLREKSKKFAIRIINLCKFLTKEKSEHILSKQILRSGTSIGANLAEAKFARSNDDLIYKSQVSLKEASETKYWLELLHETKYITTKQFIGLQEECDEIVSMLVSGIKTLKENI